MQWYGLCWVALGGALGASSRCLLSYVFNLLFGANFPFGILFVNVIGSLAMGMFMAALMNGLFITETYRQFVAVGFLGALTTFSSFSMDTVFLMQNGEFLKSGLNIGLNMLLSISAAWLGFYVISANLSN